MHARTLSKENGDLKRRCEECEIVVDGLRNENEALKVKCNEYEGAIQDMKDKMEVGAGGMEGGVNEAKFEELKNAWKQEKEIEKVTFKEVIEKQIQERTKDTVIQVIKEKEGLVRDTVEKKKSMVIFGLQEKKNPVKMAREKEEREMVRDIVTLVQDEEQGLEREIEEVFRLGKYKEGGKRPLKVRMRSQVATEGILARTGKLAEREEYKNVWIKRDMNVEEREREKDLRREAKEKNDQRTGNEKEEFYWRVMDMKLRKWYMRGREREVVGAQEEGEQQ